MKLHPSSVDDARRALVEAAVPITQTEKRRLLNANNCVLAESIFSSINVPLAKNSAMDGYAVSAAISGGKVLQVSQRIPAGIEPPPLKKGTAARIFTGAPLPEGADSVVIQEEAEENAGLVSLPEKIHEGQNVREAGEDISEGEEVFTSGHRLRAQDLGLIASVGISSILVKRPLKVAVCSTGNELVKPGSRSIKYGEVYNSNIVVLIALLKSWGMTAINFGIVPDDLDAMSKVFLQASDVADCIITTGGVSVGEEDHVKNLLSKLGDLSFWKLNIKPGKPMAFGRVGKTPLIGLPGNSVSTFTTFLLLAKPFLFAQQGNNYKELQYVPANAGFDVQM